jgi:putative SOS response-associated peptidase YedK
MCARYTMATAPDALIEELEATLVDGAAVEASYNIAPTATAPIVTATAEGERRLEAARFGFIPHWADDARVGVRMLNARAETVADKPAYRRAFARFRCLVAADGFYEWRRRGKQKIPFRFRLPDGGPFAFAGLCSSWSSPEGDRVRSFTILTRQAVGAVADVHDRMPVVLPRDGYASWLAGERASREALEAVLEAHRGEALVGEEVSTRVNHVKNDDPSLIEPV